MRNVAALCQMMIILGVVIGLVVIVGCGELLYIGHGVTYIVCISVVPQTPCIRHTETFLLLTKESVLSRTHKLSISSYKLR